MRQLRSVPGYGLLCTGVLRVTQRQSDARLLPVSAELLRQRLGRLLPGKGPLAGILVLGGNGLLEAMWNHGSCIHTTVID